MHIHCYSRAAFTAMIILSDTEFNTEIGHHFFKKYTLNIRPTKFSALYAVTVFPNFTFIFHTNRLPQDCLK